MSWNKDIRFPEKKVDSSWKDDVTQKKEGQHSPSTSAKSSTPQPASPTSQKSATVKTSKPFMNLISSLGFQALMHLGEVPNPATQEREVNLEVAQEMIGLIQSIKEKTLGNTSAEETELLLSLLSELQMKFADRV